MGLNPTPYPKKGNRSFSVTTAPTEEPLTLTEFKTFSRIDTDVEDSLLTEFIKSARILCEKWLGLALITQTITMYMDQWPGTTVELPLPPLQSITSIHTIDQDDNFYLYDSSNYYTDTSSYFGRIIIKSGSAVPTTVQGDFREYQQIRIIYAAGYGSAADVPLPIKHGVAMWATALYEQRAIGTEPPPQAIPILNNYKVEKL